MTNSHFTDEMAANPPSSAPQSTTLSMAGMDDAVLASAVDCLGAALIVCDAGTPDCPIIFVSNAFRVITQYTPRDVLGRNLGFLISNKTEPETLANIQKAISDRAACRAEFRCFRNNASPLWCELILTPVPARGDSPAMLTGLLTDISERKEQELHLRDAQTRYAGIFENAVEGIYQSSPEGQYLSVNPALARMYGYDTPGELLDQVSDISKQIYVDPSFRERFRREIEEVGQIRGFEYKVRRRDGSIIWISESARAVRDAAGKIRYYEGFIEDITPRKNAEVARARLEKQMVQAQKMEAMGTLAGGIAHDFNNILCAMLGLTELALGNEQLTGQSRKNLEAVLKSAGRAKDLIRQILTFSRRSQSECAPVRVISILKECVKLLNASLPSSIQITSCIMTNDDVVIADATEIHQVIMNLGTNAAHAMRKNGGRLTYELNSADLTAEQAARLGPLKPGPHVCLSVRDIGHGMSREVMESIFDPFFTTKPPGEGTGLGLTLVQRIVARYGGHTEVASEENVGTTFTLYFPRGQQQPVPTLSLPRKDQLVPGARERILVVDDEIIILDMLQQHLRKLGYRVTTRADSLTALDTFKSDPSRFDLVLTDHTMPAMQGAELAERLGEIRADVPVILMTGLNQPPSFANSCFAARRIVLRKPLDFVDLSQRLRGFLEKPVTS
jgi:two-component system cell cycle sensor histidine kinase/response regulator CckA